jgi:hypothetical protein
MKIHVHWMNLIKNQIIQKLRSFEILKERATKQKNSFKKPFDKKIMFNGFKMQVTCAGNKLAKKMFTCLLEVILKSFEIFFLFIVLNQNIHI